MPESFVERHPHLVRFVGIPSGVLMSAIGVTLLTSDLDQPAPPVLGSRSVPEVPCDYSEIHDMCAEDWLAGAQLIVEVNNRRSVAELSPLREDEVLMHEAGFILDVLGSLEVNPTLDEHNLLRGVAQLGIAKYQGLGEEYSSIDSISASFDKTQGVSPISAYEMLFAWQEEALGEMMSSRRIDSIGVAFRDMGEYSLVVAVVANNEVAI